MTDKKPAAHTPQPSPPSAEIKTAGATTRGRVKSSDLPAGTNELLIEHNGGVYSLRQTSNGKLILTK